MLGKRSRTNLPVLIHVVSLPVPPDMWLSRTAESCCYHSIKETLDATASTRPTHAQ